MFLDIESLLKEPPVSLKHLQSLLFIFKEFFHDQCALVVDEVSGCLRYKCEMLTYFFPDSVVKLIGKKFSRSFPSQSTEHG